MIFRQKQNKIMRNTVLPWQLNLPQNSKSTRLICVLTWKFFLSKKKMGDVKWNFSTFCGLSGTTTYQKLPQRTIDPLDPIATPRWGPNLDVLHKTKSSSQIVILITHQTCQNKLKNHFFTYKNQNILKILVKMRKKGDIENLKY